jgi:fimbrial chaperone protein
MGKLVMAFKTEWKMIRHQLWLLRLCAICLAAMPAAHAFKLVPITMDFDPSGRGASRVFRVENDSEKRVAVQISIFQRTMTIDGQEENTPAEDDFMVYPAQMILKPGEVQSVRVKWLGNPDPERELSYRIFAEQLPINLTKEKQSGAKINLIVRYLGSIYIVPKGAKANVEIASIAPSAGPDGERRMSIVFQNRGTAHAILRDLQLTLKAGGKKIQLRGEHLEGIAGENILAGAARRVILPWPPELPEGEVEAQFDFHHR